MSHSLIRTSLRGVLRPSSNYPQKPELKRQADEEEDNLSEISDDAEDFFRKSSGQMRQRIC